MSFPSIFVPCFFFYWYPSAGGQAQDQDHEDHESYEDHGSCEVYEGGEGHECHREYKPDALSVKLTVHSLV